MSRVQQLTHMPNQAPHLVVPLQPFPWQPPSLTLAKLTLPFYIGRACVCACGQDHVDDVAFGAAWYLRDAGVERVSLLYS
jgi:hypothetical protein